MTWRDMTGQDVTWRDMTWRDMTWHYVIWHDVTWGTSRGMTWHDVTWRDMMWHDMTWHDVTSLRSSSRTLLCPKLTRTNYGDRAFSASAPRIWNKLPANFNFSDNLNIFKKRLKTFLFNCAFNWLFRGRKWSSMSLYLRTLWHVK